MQTNIKQQAQSKTNDDKIPTSNSLLNQDSISMISRRLTQSTQRTNIIPANKISRRNNNVMLPIQAILAQILNIGGKQDSNNKFQIELIQKSPGVHQDPNIKYIIWSGTIKASHKNRNQFQCLQSIWFQFHTAETKLVSISNISYTK